MNIISKLNSIFSYNERKVYGAEVWMVYWYAYSNGCSVQYPHVEKKSKAFLNKKDADSFVENLKHSLDVLQFDLDIRIKIEKQK